ncbi:hypothetical protein [Geobacter sp.]|uniref:hypothetical protein n=1 Tax=Geobacter sp. TaxID=46610 RepID=UPI0026285C61|nr:hypothetical protein [Geobacter sp.]
MVSKRFARLLFLGSLLAATSGWGADFHGRSSTQLLWFDDFYNGRQVEVAEYLRVSVTNVDKGGKFSIAGYGRGTQDLNNGEGINGRLYYLYGDYRGLFDKLDLRIGRQFVNSSAGTALVDGGMFDLKNIGAVGFTVFGGRDVIFGLNGETGHEGDYVLGMSAYLAGFRNTDLDFAWFRKWDQGDVSRDILGASFKQYLFNRMKVYANARYDLTSEVFNEVLAGVKYFPIARLIFTGEWYQSYPTFDTTSIYSVFAVNRYQEGVFRVDYTITDMFAVNGGYTRQDFGDDGTSDVFEVGCTIRPIEKVTINLNYDRRDGYGGQLNGGMLDVTYDATKSLQLATGMTYDVYNRDFFTSNSEQHSAQLYWVGGRYRLAKSMQASLRIEDNVNKTYNNSVQGRFPGPTRAPWDPRSI